MTDSATKAVPKIKASGISRTALIWGVLIILTFGGIAGAGTYYKKYVKDSPEKVKVMRHTGEIDQADWIFETEPEEVVVEEMPEPEPEPIKEPEPEQIVNIIQPRPTPSASDLFNPVEIEENNLVASFNEQRRGAMDIKVSRDIYGTVEKTEYEMEQTRWSDSPEDETTATFPIDMKRVIPVYMTIPATIIQAIDSEITGKVVAQINQNIYGGEGRNILIPAGSKATGYYSPLQKYGEERLSIVWKMIDTPDGIRILTENAEMADAMGRTGIAGRLDNKNWEKYGIPLLVSTIQLATAYAFPVKSDGQRVLVEGYGSSVASMGQKVLDENIQLKPKLELDPGEHIIISPLKDIRFPKPIKRKIQAVAVED